ncbi:MAG: signal recognition particle-docking protein FtsY [Bdellovibrionaceae bacterium]|nr:signal recognition particle-docking protein FtsY [Pseudobdellovibrionaceae bacterium]
MEQFDSTTYFILGGFVVALLVGLIVYFLSRQASRSDRIERIEREPGPVAGPLPIPTPADEAHEAGAVQSVEPTPVAARDERAIERVPADVVGRAEGSTAISAPAHPHTIEEIQRKPLKPLASALEKTRGSFFGRLRSVFSQKEVLSAHELADLEEVLYTSDLGPQTVQRLLGAVEVKLKASGTGGFEAVRDAIKAEMIGIFDAIPAGAVPNGKGSGVATSSAESGNGHAHNWDAEEAIIAHAASEYVEGLEKLNIWSHKPAVLLIVGVNGAGKTTTIGKLSRRIAQSGRKVLVAAGDTFRAAAGDQLKVWTERAAVEIFSPEGVTDPSAVAFDACQTAQAKGFDVVIIDTAGRLHTQKNLMEELKKLKRVITKVIADAPHETLLVLDANNGQNALQQAREFHGALQVSGVVLTKLDGSAKGGVAVGLACELGLPIKLIGVGEGIEDLRAFSPQEFVNSII